MKKEVSKFDYLKFKKEILALLSLIVGIIALYVTFSPTQCENIECFADKMSKCSPSEYLNEGKDATWDYRVQGIDGNKCAVRVTLLNAKEGELGLREFEGTSMTCFFNKGTIAYPERNLGFCHGELKENLQQLVIEKLYDYVVINLKDLRDELIFS